MKCSLCATDEGGMCAVIFLWPYFAKMNTLVILDRMKCFIDAQSSVVALFVYTRVNWLVHPDPTSFDAVVHVLVAFVQCFLATAYTILYLTRPGAFFVQQLLDLIIRRT